ncbi:MAG: recombination-associated protein RdgC [Nevskiaceae bacterium]|nr:MAG: recombination-associated protein RdgC [Nevskiaceae bacterium]TBR72024.1 MAG: recombination-associated protein RdgC [Nevskiaceae bacterium]
MWFRNLQIYHLDQPWTLSPGGLEQVLAEHPLQPCPPLAMTSRGFVAPGVTPALVESLDRHLLFALGMERKLLPASVVADRANVFAAEFEKSRGVKPGRKLQREFKDRATSELLPRAFARRRVVRVWIDAAHARLIADSPSPTPAEEATETLRDALGELALSLPTPDRAPDEILSGWLRDGAAPAGFLLGEECELTGPDETRPTLRYQRHPLQTKEIQQHLADGFHVTKLALTWRERVSFVVDHKLQIKRVHFLGIDESNDSPELNPEERFAAEFALMAGNCTALLDELLPALGVAAAG